MPAKQRSLSPQLMNATIVLVRPRNPGNLGAVARVMKNLGLKRLALVDPQTELSEEADAWACGAEDLLRRACCFPDLPAAVKRCGFVIGSTGRGRSFTPPQIFLEELADSVRQRADSSAGESAGATALVFGPERTGLTSEELAFCHVALRIPTKRNFASLNLAQAVALVAWELSKASRSVQIADRPKSVVRKRAAHGQLEAMFAQAEEALLAADFLKEGKPLGPMITLRQLIDRATPSPEDVRFLRGVFRQINNLAKRKKRA